MIKYTFKWTYKKLLLLIVIITILIYYDDILKGFKEGWSHFAKAKQQTVVGK